MNFNDRDSGLSIIYYSFVSTLGVSVIRISNLIRLCDRRDYQEACHRAFSQDDVGKHPLGIDSMESFHQTTAASEHYRSSIYLEVIFFWKTLKARHLLVWVELGAPSCIILVRMSIPIGGV